MQNNQKIPEGWSFKKLGELFFKSQKKNIEEKNIPVLTNSAVKGVVPQNEYFDREIVSEENLSNYYYVECGDFIYNPRISKTAPAGPIKRNRFTKPGCVSPLYTVFKIASNVSEEFYENYFESNLWAYEAYKVANYGARSDRMNITDKDFFNIKLPFPPLPEQEKIAEILSCWDDGIEKLSALIEKKKIQKKALMQQLLTGKHRLKGFSTPWHEVRLGGVCKTFSGGTPSAENQTYYGGNIPFIRSGEIHLDRTDLFITNKALENTSAKLVSKGDLLYALYGATSGEVDISKIDGAINQAILCIRSQHMDLYFLCCLLQNKKEKILRKYLQGGQGNLSAEIIKSLMIPEPDLAEQKAIAKILSKADEEIELLNKKLEAFKQEKKALMQQLLTGKIRVKVN